MMSILHLLLAVVLVHATAPTTGLGDSGVASTTLLFSLRQSFYHSLDDRQDTVHFLYHDFEDGSTSGVATSETLPKLQVQAHIVTMGLSDPVDRDFAQQHVLTGKASSHLQYGPLTPNVTDRATVINLAKMTSDAYYDDPSVPDWLNLTDGFNRSQSFGWDKDGLRGHVFANAHNSTVVIAFKGTTFWDRHRKHDHDRENDKILFSCCCATQRKDPYWYGPVCDCRNSTFSCNQTCLSSECGREDRYYAKAKEVVSNVSSTFPDARKWMVGHSLGGAIASLMGMTFHAPVVTFEAVPERLPAQRLGLEMSGPDYFPAYHFGNTADPVYMGTCHGFLASCSIAGYAFESQCFTGKRCVYDTMTDHGWFRHIGNHRINTVIDSVLEKYETTPECEIDDECGECHNWSFFDGP